MVGNELKDIAELMTYGFFKKDEVIIDTHTPQEYMYFILDGMVSFSVDYQAPGFVKLNPDTAECLGEVSKDLEVPK